MHGVPSHSYAPTHASICLGVLSSQVQNLIWQVKNFVWQFLFCIDYQYLDNVFYKRSTRDILHQPLLVSVYRHLRDRNENQLLKDLCRIKNWQIHCLLFRVDKFKHPPYLSAFQNIPINSGTPQPPLNISSISLETC